MHAYLIAGSSEKAREKEKENLIVKYGLKKIDLTLLKMEDTKELIKLTRLKVLGKTAVIIDNVDKATEEALNAFLKILEEPQENLVFILTSNSIEGVLPTIVSRCQVIEVGSEKLPQTTIDETEKFLESPAGEKLKKISSITSRDEAIKFLETLLSGGHALLTTHPKGALLVDNGLKTLYKLKANGNLQLTLTHFVVSLESIVQ